ncbi:MAG: manganese-dependent ADP-ribose/CDP-alcohol diphosphatase [Verrucomicrobiales bacterium]|jgi:manganese-dependent ADP-ribose/CDP-alcohol diphosphatase
MKTRRQFLATSGSALAAAGAVAQTDKPIFSFGLMADCQYVDAETRGSRFYRESPRKLEEAINALNQRELAFTFHLGDLIDRDFESFDILAPIAAKIKSKLHHALGNHDFEVADEHKSKVPGKLGLENGYYSFRKDAFRFIVIDTTDVSPYRHPASSEASQAAAAELAKLKADGSAGAQPWNGRPGAEQIVWLESELKAATEAKETVIVAGHHPILPVEGHSMWNAKTMDELLQKHSCAKLYLNGHNHAGHYVDAKGLHFLTLDGMVETEKENAYAFADLYADRLEIKGIGRQESHTLKFR